MRMSWHIAKAKQLVSAVGGPKEAADLLGMSYNNLTRYTRGELYFTGPQIVALESAAMVPIYSGDMAGLIASPACDGDPVDHALSATTHAAKLAETLVRALTDQVITENERREMRPFIAALRNHLENVERAVEGLPVKLEAAE